MENLEDYEGFAGIEDISGYEGPEIDRRPFFEPGNMMCYSDFETYYTAMVIMPQVHEKEEELGNFLEEIRKFHTREILACSDMSDVESFHDLFFGKIKSAFNEAKISERGFRAAQRLGIAKQ